MRAKPFLYSGGLTVLFGLLVVACGDDDSTVDAGYDAGVEMDTDTDTGDDPDTDYDLDAGPDSGSSVTHVHIEMNEKVKTVLNVSWIQTEDADNAWLEFTFENDEWFESPAVGAAAGEHEQVILGVPGETEVTFRVVTETGGVSGETRALTASTGAVPSIMPCPTVESYNASIASQNRWLFGSVDDTQSEETYYFGPFWLYIIDRQGRIVWYYSNIGDNPVIGFPRVSRDGRYIFFGNRIPWDYNQAIVFVPKVTKMSLDWKYFEQIEIPLSDNVDMTDDGAFLYNTTTWEESALYEYFPDGTTRQIWDCHTKFDIYDCYSNTVNWNPIDDTVLMSFPYVNTALEIERQSGEIVGQYGNGEECYAFVPDSWGFEFQHFANITPDGTLLVSSHMPGGDEEHAFMEFEIDRENKTLTEKWIYDEGDEWAMYMGEAHRVPNGNGNVLANYGTGGVIKEITPDKQTAWYVKWDAPIPDDHYNKMVGHCTLLDDLYAINRGPQ